MKDYSNLPRMPLHEITQDLGNPTMSMSVKDMLAAEITRRTAQAQIDAARYMNWSVIAIAITSGLTAFAAIVGWLFPNPLGH